MGAEISIFSFLSILFKKTSKIWIFALFLNKIDKNEKNRKFRSHHFEPTDNTVILRYHTPRLIKNWRRSEFSKKILFFNFFMKNHNFYAIIMQFRFFFTRNILIITLYSLYVLTGHFQPLCYHIYKNAYIPVVPIVPIREHFLFTLIFEHHKFIYFSFHSVKYVFLHE